jgi:hypothetical protein
MIPFFPDFKNLELSDREEIEKITSLFPPHSDFHFISIFCWDIDNTTTISVLNNNLIIRQIDCLTGEKYISLIGNIRIPDTINMIATWLKNKNLPIVFRWVPEETVQCLIGVLATVTEDRDYFDYIYDVKELHEAKGGKYKSYRHDISHFKKTYPFVTVKRIDLKNEEIQNHIFLLYDKWLDNKGSKYDLSQNEHEIYALKKLIRHADHFEHLYSIGIFDQEKLIGFSIEYLENDKYGCGLFWKGDIEYAGIYNFLMQESIKVYYLFQKKFMNADSDIGIDALRQSKEKYYPVYFLKRYKIELI